MLTSWPLAVSVCLLFGDEQVVFSGCLELFQLPAGVENYTMRAVRVNPNSKAAGQTDKQRADTVYKGL